MHIHFFTARRFIVLSVAIFYAGFAQAQATLRGEAELTQILKKDPPCCVIDARGEEQQRKAPMADALRYRPGLQIIPTASVIVVADRDQDAMSVGVALAKQHPGKAIYAVKGGVATWEVVVKALAKVTSSQAPGMSKGISFVIPHNTCETGTPLQTLTGKPKP